MNELPISVLLKELRGEQQQLKLSQELGYNFNQYFKWESGTTSITLQNFHDLCQYLGFDLREVFASVLNCFYCEFDQGEILHELYSKWSLVPEEDFLNKINYSKSKWWRLKNGQTKLTLDDFLEIIEVLMNKKASFLSAISSEFKKKKYLHRKGTNALTEESIFKTINEYPEFIAIYSAFFLNEFVQSKTYNERKEVLIRHCDEDRERIEEVIDYLEKAGIIDLHDPVQDAFRVILTTANFNLSDHIASYVLRLYENRLKKETNHPDVKPHEAKKARRIVASPIIAAVSQETELAINALLEKAFREVVALISNEKIEDKSRLMYFYVGHTQEGKTHHIH